MAPRSAAAPPPSNTAGVDTNAHTELDVAKLRANTPRVFFGRPQDGEAGLHRVRRLVLACPDCTKHCLESVAGEAQNLPTMQLHHLRKRLQCGSEKVVGVFCADPHDASLDDGWQGSRFGSAPQERDLSASALDCCDG